MRVAIVINTSWNIWNFRMGLVRSFQDAGHEVVAIAPRDDYSSSLEEAGVRFVPVEMQNKGSNPIHDYRMMKRLRKIYREVNPDVILHYTIKPNIFGTIAAAKLKIPVINNVSGLGTVFLHDNLVTKIAKRLYKRSFKRASKVFFQNSDDLHEFLSRGLVDKSICDLLPGSGVNLAKFTPSNSGRNKPFTFLVISRALYDKGIMEYAEAATILKEKRIDVNCQLVGFIEDDTSLGIDKSEIEEWKKMGLIDYLGTTDDVRPLINNADVVILPSYREGTPRSLLEAIAMGKPIVTTDVPGCRETVVDGKNGYLCKVKNGEDLAAKMEQIMNLNPEEFKSMGNESRKLAETKFDEQIVIRKYLEVIDQLTK